MDLGEGKYGSTLAKMVGEIGKVEKGHIFGLKQATQKKNPCRTRQRLPDFMFFYARSSESKSGS